MMKIFFTIFLGLTLAQGIFAQIKSVHNVTNNVSVEEISLAKDDGEGKPGDVVEGFLTTDMPIHCIVQLNSLRPAVVKMNFVAVAVKGVKAETKVITVNYKTNGEQNRVYFTGKPVGKWIAGTYRADIFIDGKPSGKKEFQIQNPIAENPMVKSLQPKNKPSKRIRKN